MAATNPSEDYLEETLGSWTTIAGINPTASELIDAAVEIIDGEESTDLRTAQRTMQFVWRRLQLPHTSEWKRAEDRCQRVLSHLSAETTQEIVGGGE